MGHLRSPDKAGPRSPDMIPAHATVGGVQRS